MQIQLTAILEHFCLLAGLDSDTSAAWLPLCAEAKIWMERRLRPGVDPDRDGDRLALAAAGIANHRHALMASDTGLGSLRVADLSITADKTDRAAQAARLRDELLGAVSDCLCWDGGPVLLGAGC